MKFFLILRVSKRLPTNPIIWYIEQTFIYLSLCLNEIKYLKKYTDICLFDICENYLKTMRDDVFNFCVLRKCSSYIFRIDFKRAFCCLKFTFITCSF